MYKNKFITMLSISFLIFSLCTINIFANNQATQTQLEQFLQELKEFESEYYLLGKSVLEDQCAHKNKDSLKKDINFYLSNLHELRSRIEDYLDTIKNDKIQYRNITALIFVSEYLQMGLEELLILLDVEDDTTYFNSLESYFYSKILAKQTITFVEDQLNQ